MIYTGILVLVPKSVNQPWPNSLPAAGRPAVRVWHEHLDHAMPEHGQGLGAHTESVQVKRQANVLILGEPSGHLVGCAVMYRSTNGLHATCKSIDCVLQCACWSTTRGFHSTCPGACCPAELAPNLIVASILLSPCLACIDSTTVHLLLGNHLAILAAALNGPQALRIIKLKQVHVQQRSQDNTRQARVP